ncbi:MAG: restriction endonuclease subunit S, partial [Xanthomonadaceae bacterium]|nr:restriction endonuclease subunit S [Xanthomonadaceae bacterium]
MSGVGFLGKLLDGAVVKWNPLGEVLIRTKGTKITAGQMRELHKEGAPVKIFAGGKTVAFVDLGDIPANEVNREPSIIVKSRGVIEFEYYDKPFSHKNEMWSYNARGKAINIRYVYHFLKLNEPHFQNVGSKMQMPQIATPDTDKFEIPIPCPENPQKSLDIQAEIVRILDTFTELTAELTTELTARKKQYKHYRDQLLQFKDVDVAWTALGELGEFIRGKRFTKADYVEDGVPVIHYGEIYTRYGVPESVTSSPAQAQPKPNQHLDMNSALDFSNLAQAERVCAPMRYQSMGTDALNKAVWVFLPASAQPPSLGASQLADLSSGAG